MGLAIGRGCGSDFELHAATLRNSSVHSNNLRNPARKAQTLDYGALTFACCTCNTKMLTRYLLSDLRFDAKATSRRQILQLSRARFRRSVRCECSVAEIIATIRTKQPEQAPTLESRSSIMGQASVRQGQIGAMPDIDW